MQLFHGALHHKDKTNYLRALLGFDQRMTAIEAMQRCRISILLVIFNDTELSNDPLKYTPSMYILIAQIIIEHQGLYQRIYGEYIFI
ncbi:hypothetical protein RGU72_04100 [Undibacterium sp. 5I1]|uniref:hypothetical protein n=1 Tax=unclassified Undibacterium TaxID=2630295 RepID=UPI002AB3358E|nr:MULTISPECIES: hypothetical protein [unclassified Undibacterium]MDY7537441.1 hypothetical protein [Undibacterium sp. 5I1]MEB0232075.1 hypothetical protein [Undibacterium sp. 10I3]MEB0259364.1 hypothetical protein [Undibacterium sp. 5I1]